MVAGDVIRAYGNWHYHIRAGERLFRFIGDGANLTTGVPAMGLFLNTGGTLSHATISLWAGGAAQCALPTFSPVAGSYSSTQTVTITSTASSTVYYTLDGTTPTHSSSSIAERCYSKRFRQPYAKSNWFVDVVCG